MGMQEDDAKLFREAMSGVRPLKAPAKVTHTSPRRRYRRPAPTNIPELPMTPQEDGTWDRVGERVFWQRDGIRPQDINKLKKGQFAKHWSIDLHGLTQEAAEAELKSFLYQAWQLGARHVLVIHGKGYNSAEGPVLKTMVHQLLPTLPFVLAFSSTQPKDGDTGATYVFLKALDKRGSP